MTRIMTEIKLTDKTHQNSSEAPPYTVAQLAALTAREKHAAKKQARAQALEASSSDAPPAKQRKLD